MATGTTLSHLELPPAESGEEGEDGVDGVQGELMLASSMPGEEWGQGGR